MLSGLLSSWKAKRLNKELHRRAKAVLEDHNGEWSDTLRALLDRKGIRARENQVAAAIGLTEKLMIQMDTGEGKTVAIALAAAKLVKEGERVVIMTTNPYLSRRDFNEMLPFYQELGISVKCHDDSDKWENEDNHQIIYSSPGALIFPWLRKTLDFQVPIWNWSHVILDEADMILMEQSSFPFVIAEENQFDDYETLNLILTLLRKKEKNDFILNHDENWCSPTDACLDELDDFLDSKGIEKVFQNPTITEHVFACCKALFLLILNVDYIVENNKVIPIDVGTGRKDVSKRFGSGVHEALEMLHGLPVGASCTIKTEISMPVFLSNFKNVSGISGSLRLSGDNWVSHSSPTWVDRDRPSKKIVMDCETFLSWNDKAEFCLNETIEMINKGRPVLIGTYSVEESIRLSEKFKSLSIPHRVLNALNESEEHELIALAGMRSHVTIATNVAGRGTDIEIKDEVDAIGGLHVVLFSPNLSKRQDDQFLGRVARNGKSGSARRLACGEDWLFKTWECVRKPNVKDITHAQANHETNARTSVLSSIKVDMLLNHYRQKWLLEKSLITSNIGENLREIAREHLTSVLACPELPLENIREKDLLPLFKSKHIKVEIPFKEFEFDSGDEPAPDWAIDENGSGGLSLNDVKFLAVADFENKWLAWRSRHENAREIEKEAMSKAFNAGLSYFTAQSKILWQTSHLATLIQKDPWVTFVNAMTKEGAKVAINRNHEIYRLLSRNFYSMDSD